MIFIGLDGKPEVKEGINDGVLCTSSEVQAKGWRAGQSEADAKPLLITPGSDNAAFKGYVGLIFSRASKEVGRKPTIWKFVRKSSNQPWKQV